MLFTINKTTTMNRFLTFLIAVSTILGFASCSQNDIDEITGTESVTTTFTLNLEDLGTRLAGDATTINKVAWGIYNHAQDGKGSLVEHFSSMGTKDVDFRDGKAEVEVTLFTGKKYDLVFWAYCDKNSAYKIDWHKRELNVNYENQMANDEQNDAFFHIENGFTAGPSKTFTLRRPFAQINIGQSLDDYNNMMLTDDYITSSALKAYAYNKMNLWSGDVMGELVPVEFAMNAVLNTEVENPDQLNDALTVGGTEYKHLAMNYLLVNSKQTMDVEFTLRCTEGTDFKREYFNVPLQRNYRTNILGSVISSPSLFTIVIDSKFDNPDHEVPAVDPYLNVRIVRATDSTITIGWSNFEQCIPYIAQIVPTQMTCLAEDREKTYKVALYRDRACTDLVMSVTNINSAGDIFKSYLYPTRFVFSGLEPATTYYTVVTNLTDGTSNREPVAIATTHPLAQRSDVVKSDAKAGDMIVYENFAGLVYAADLSSRACGVSHRNRGSLTTIDPIEGEITPSSNGFYVVSAGTEIGLFNTLKGIIDDMGVQDWGWICGKDGETGGSVCARPGYVKISTKNNRSFICTPALTAIPEGKGATVKVVFNAAPYGEVSQSTIDSFEKAVCVKALARQTLRSDNKIVNGVETDAEYLTLEGDYNSDWREYEVTLENVASGGVIAIGGGQDALTINRFQLDDIRVYVESIYEYTPPQNNFANEKLPAISGTVTYSDGTPAAGVSISDGFSVVQTDANGEYTLCPDKDCYYIYYSTPAECEVATNNYGQPAFFTRFNKQKNVYNFTLTKLASGKESKFNLFCLADPQCKDSSQCSRFLYESVPAIKGHAQSLSNPNYGVTLGDIVYSEGSRNSTSYMTTMRTRMSKSRLSMPVFQTMGNHDYTYFHTDNKIYSNEQSSTFNLAIQRKFESVFGPIDHSWNRGDAHIICMRNMQWKNNSEWNSYELAFTDKQIEWLRQDLSFVPKQKLIIFCVHIPLLNQGAASAVLDLLAQFPNCHIMSGHTHYMRNEPTRSRGIYEHVHAAVSGQWWWSTINGDGCPNGYGVYQIDGNQIVNWYYMGINEGMNDRNYQIRLYRGDLICGGPKTYFHLQHGNDVIIANVFNADPSWKVKIYEDGVSYDMIAIGEKKYAPGGSNSIGTSNPVYVPTDSGQDWWAIGYHIGVVGRSGTSGSYHTNCFHMYKLTLTNPNAKIRVEATDRFGRTYSTENILENDGTDIYSSINW